MISLVFRRFLSTRKHVFVFNAESWDPEVLESAHQSCSVCEDFVTTEEEQALLTEIEPHMKRLKYETEHWDDAIFKVNCLLSSMFNSWPISVS